MADRQLSNFLKDMPLFRDLDKTDLESILHAALVRKVEQGGYFFFQGDPAERVYVLIRGQVRLLQSDPGGMPVLLNVLTPPAALGVMAMTRTNIYPVSAQAVTDCQACYWTQPDMDALMVRYPRWERNAMHILANHALEFQERYRQLATERVERRLAHTLLRLSRQLGKETPQGILINLPLTRQDLAEMSGTTLYTVSRTLRQWEAEGVVSLGRERVVIRSQPGLLSIAEGIPSPDEMDSFENL